MNETMGTDLIDKLARAVASHMPPPACPGRDSGIRINTGLIWRLMRF